MMKPVAWLMVLCFLRFYNEVLLNRTLQVITFRFAGFSVAKQ